MGTASCCRVLEAFGPNFTPGPLWTNGYSSSVSVTQTDLVAGFASVLCAKTAIPPGPLSTEALEG